MFFAGKEEFYFSYIGKRSIILFLITTLDPL